MEKNERSTKTAQIGAVMADGRKKNDHVCSDFFFQSFSHLFFPTSFVALISFSSAPVFGHKAERYLKNHWILHCCSDEIMKTFFPLNNQNMIPLFGNGENRIDSHVLHTGCVHV